jgi:hypothetical protein
MALELQQEVGGGSLSSPETALVDNLNVVP